MNKKNLKTCPQCGDEYTPKTYNQQFCSKSCLLARNLSELEDMRFRIFARDGFKCVYCGQSTYADDIKLTIDHIKPLANGGDNNINNIVAACTDCNSQKSSGILSNLIINDITNSIKLRNKCIADQSEINNFFIKRYKARTR